MFYVKAETLVTSQEYNRNECHKIRVVITCTRKEDSEVSPLYFKVHDKELQKPDNEYITFLLLCDLRYVKSSNMEVITVMFIEHLSYSFKCR